MIETKRYDEYISTNEVLKKKNTRKFERYVFSLGYIDGLYGEEEYKRYVPEDDRCNLLYETGHKEGQKDKENNSSKTSFTKSVWLSKLAVTDYKNGYRDRNLTEEAQILYDLNYEDLIEIGDRPITDENYAEAEKHFKKH